MNPREFATQITQQLQSAGHTALFAGGCVRDDLLGRAPKDFDVATSALPEQVRELFGHRKTLAIGAAFGVITIVGPKSAGNIEVATFRRDGGYSDGRRPDSVEFTDAREDAIRRDFTINGMFFDPVARQVIDYVGGQQDLKAGLIRAIGNPHERFDEDKLRMLRAVRFSTTYQFQIEQETLAAVRERAREIAVVSPERIGVELRKIMISPARAYGVDVLSQSNLLPEILSTAQLSNSSEVWEQAKSQAECLGETDFVTATVVLLGHVLEQVGVDSIFDAWRLTNQEKSGMNWLLTHLASIRQANKVPWSQVQRLFLNDNIHRAVQILDAELKHCLKLGTTERGRDLELALQFCRQKLALDSEQLDPPPWLTGDDLKAAGMRPGRQFAEILRRIRDEQLDGLLDSKASALERARELEKARRN